MEGNWMSVEAAAEALEVSTRTIERRVKAGELESRLSDQGRREVLVSTPPTDTDNLSDTVSAIEARAERGLQVASVAVQISRELADAHAAELKRTRRVAVTGWSIAAVLVVALGVGVYLVARQAGVIELKAAEAAHLTDKVADQANRLAVEGDRLTEARRQAEKAASDLEAARADRRQVELRAAELQARLDQAVKATATPSTSTWLTWLAGK